MRPAPSRPAEPPAAPALAGRLLTAWADAAVGGHGGARPSAAEPLRALLRHRLHEGAPHTATNGDPAALRLLHLSEPGAEARPDGAVSRNSPARPALRRAGLFAAAGLTIPPPLRARLLHRAARALRPDLLRALTPPPRIP